MAQVRGVLLDVDGTLIDSNDQHAQAWVDAFEKGGYPISYEMVRPLIGMGGDNLLPQLIGRSKDSPAGQQLAQWEGEFFKARYEKQVRAFPRTRDLLQRMRDRGLKLAIATSAKPEELATLLEIAGVQDLIHTQASSGDGKDSKPDPDIIDAALRRLGFDPDEVVMIGDTPYDVAAAGKLNVRTIAFRCGGWRDPDLVGALARYEDPADLLAHYDESPLARGIATGQGG